MSPFEKLLDDWCYEHADCNLNAWRNADYRNPMLADQFIRFVCDMAGKKPEDWSRLFKDDPAYMHEI